jgi:predicted adenine nucleotide alpha hydrolase (AANH) superfamily ATPase
MRRALVEILRKIDNTDITWVVIDWNDNYEFDELEKKPIFIVWWDSKILEIWASSIIAKVFRDRLMNTYSLLYPDLHIDNHKWYGTKKHINYLTDKSKITWIHRLSYKPVKEVINKKPRLLLHVCCWPDATVPIMDLKKDYDVIWFWYDPNIQPKREYKKRLDNFIKICKIENIPFLEGEYDVINFFDEIKWLEHTPEKWEKCTKCYDMRLRETAKLAKEMWIKYWTSTLNTSPHKDLEKMFSLWDKHSLENKLEFLKIAFRKNGWFERSVEYTKKHDIYRQNYCWCIYSDTFPYKK